MSNRPPRQRGRRVDVGAWRLRLKANDYADKTISTYTAAVTSIAKHCGKEPHNLRPTDIEALFLAKRYKPRTRELYMRALRAYAAFAHIPDPTKGLRRVPVPESVPSPLTERELAVLLGRLRGNHRLWVLFGAYCGLRAHEVAQLHSGDFLEDIDGALSIRVTGKGSKLDLVPVPEHLAHDPDLQRLLMRDGHLFPGRARDHVDSRTVSQAISHAARECGIQMRFHQNRHRFGTQVHRARGDLLLTQRAMRHSSPKSTAGYAKVADEDRVSVVNALPIPTLEPAPAKEPATDGPL